MNGMLYGLCMPSGTLYIRPLPTLPCPLDHPMRRLLTLLVLALPLALAGCDTSGPDEITIENASFHPSLNVDLSAMTRTGTGLYYRDLDVGSGAEVSVSDVVSVRYTGWFIDGRQLDSNVGEPHPFRFMVGGDSVIEGFHQGVIGMNVGGRRQLVVPPDLGYGGRWHGPIPPNTILVFIIEVVGSESSLPD
jgi:FKBP-type peptidyl-prolyl cis-trans isomerase FkpA